MIPYKIANIIYQQSASKCKHHFHSALITSAELGMSILASNIASCPHNPGYPIRDNHAGQWADWLAMFTYRVLCVRRDLCVDQLGIDRRLLG